MGKAIKTDGVGSRTTAHLNLTRSLADFAKPAKRSTAIDSKEPSYPNRFASKARPKADGAR